MTDRPDSEGTVWKLVYLAVMLGTIWLQGEEGSWWVGPLVALVTVIVLMLAWSALGLMFRWVKRDWRVGAGVALLLLAVGGIAALPVVLALGGLFLLASVISDRLAARHQAGRHTEGIGGFEMKPTSGSVGAQYPQASTTTTSMHPAQKDTTPVHPAQSKEQIIDLVDAQEKILAEEERLAEKEGISVEEYWNREHEEFLAKEKSVADREGMTVEEYRRRYRRDDAESLEGYSEYMERIRQRATRDKDGAS